MGEPTGTHGAGTPSLGTRTDRKSATSIDTELPVVDISTWLAATKPDDPGCGEVAKQVAHACATTGFLILTGVDALRLPRADAGGAGTPVVSDVIEAAAAAGRVYFQNTSVEQRAQQSAAAHAKTATADGAGGQTTTDDGGAYGYFPMKSEALGYNAEVGKRPDLREAFSMGPPLRNSKFPPLSLRIVQKFDLPQGEHGYPVLSDAQVAEDGTFADKVPACDPERAEFFQRVIRFCYQPTPWPEAKPEAKYPLQPALTGWYDAMSMLGREVLEIMGCALDLPAGFFAQAVSEGEHSNSARAIWYPMVAEGQSANPAEQYRCGPHSDSGAITLLWCDGPGLEIQCADDGKSTFRNNFTELGSRGGEQEDEKAARGDAEAAENGSRRETACPTRWVPVLREPVGLSEDGDGTKAAKGLPTSAVLVNIGDVLEKVSGGRWKSTPHRVPIPCSGETNEDRLSLVHFVMPAPDFPMHPKGYDAPADPDVVTQGEYTFRHFKRWGRNGSGEAGTQG